MSPDTDRIAVPTNGRKPHRAPKPDVSAEPTSVPPAEAATPSAATPETMAPGTSDQELSVAFTPKQLAIGFGIVASLVLLVAGRARRGRWGR
jgi:hypothetical protein